MSELSAISGDKTNKHEQQEEETSLINGNKIESELQSVKTTEENSYYENDSEYEDVEEDECDGINDTSVLTSVTNKSLIKPTMDDDELRINIKPRRINKKHQDDEHSEGYEDDDDNQNVPKRNHDRKKSNQNKELLDDDNDTQNPAYIPRKGKFYEHDDRTLDENDRSKQEISRNENRFYQDSDAKWQHDLYYRDEQISKPRRPIPRQDSGRLERHRDYDRQQLHLHDYMPRSQTSRNDYYQPQYYKDYHRRIPHQTDTKIHHSPVNNFSFKDYNRPLSSNRNSYNKDTNISKEIPVIPRQQRRGYDPYQIDERTFHRRRNFTNSQFQQLDNVSKVNNNPSIRNDRRRFDQQSKENNQFKDNHAFRNYGEQNRDLKRYDLYENKTNLPPRLQGNNNYRNFIQKQPYQQNSISNLSTNGSNIERPKRYSNMRHNMTNSVQQQQASSSQIQHSNRIEPNDWPQAPPPPISYLPQQMTTSEMYYQQQTSRYVPLNYSQASISEQFPETK